jgi:hypothetical protein
MTAPEGHSRPVAPAADSIFMKQTLQNTLQIKEEDPTVIPLGL